MDEYSFSNRLYSYMFYALASGMLIVSVFFYNILLFAFASLCMFLAAMYYSSGHILNNILLKHSFVVETYNEYRLSDNLSSAIKKSGNEYKAVSVSILTLNRGVSVNSSEMLSIIEGVHEPFEFSISIKEINKKALIENLETKRRMREISLARVSSNSYDKANGIKRELEVYEKEIEGVRGKGKSLDVKIVIKTNSASVDEAEAARSSFSNLLHVSDAFSTILNADYTVLRGEELLFSLG